MYNNLLHEGNKINVWNGLVVVLWYVCVFVCVCGKSGGECGGPDEAGLL